MVVLGGGAVSYERGTPVTQVAKAMKNLGIEDLTLVTRPRRSLGLKLSDTRVYEPQIRARHGEHVTWRG